MKKVVLRLDLHDDKCKKKVMKTVSSIYGLDSISMDMKDKKLTLIGDIDPVGVVSKLRKAGYHTEIVSVGPAKEPENKKKDESKKEDNAKNKDGSKKDEGNNQAHLMYYPLPPVRGYYASMEEDPNSCVIC